MRLKATDPFAYKAKAYLNGVFVNHCLEADEDAGWVRVAVISRKGRLINNPQKSGCLTKVLKGEVRIECDDINFLRLYRTSQT